MRLAHKTALVTGATSGIGEAIAHVFAREGAEVVVTGRYALPQEIAEAALYLAPSRAISTASRSRSTADTWQPSARSTR